MYTASSATREPRLALFESTLARATFQNPVAAGADPWVVQHGGWYYWCLSEDMLGVGIYRSRSVTELGERITGWRAPRFGAYCAEVWAPELHFLDGRWYVYVAASDGNNATHRMIVLSVDGHEPTGEIGFLAELYTGDDVGGGSRNCWAIDGTILELAGKRYFLWSGWEDERDQQWLYIAEMTNPWTIASNRVRLCANDDFVWERVGESHTERGLNEAPQVLQRDGRVFVVFSASGSWEPTYKLGLLELSVGGNPMSPADWNKVAEPVLKSTPATWGVGHCSFTTSPDGTENWIAFHVKLDRGANWNRAIHVQPFHWDANGRPAFGHPVAAGQNLPVPSSTEAYGDARPLARQPSPSRNTFIANVASDPSAAVVIAG